MASAVVTSGLLDHLKLDYGLVDMAVFNFFWTWFMVWFGVKLQQNNANVDRFQLLAARLFLTLRKTRVTQMKVLIQPLRSQKCNI